MRKVIHTTGAMTLSARSREVNDFYATEPRAMELLLQLEDFAPYVWECACGEGHLSKVLEAKGYQVLSTDLIDRGYGMTGINFLRNRLKFWKGDIITNPPYKLAKEFIERALDTVHEGRKVAMLLKVTFLESAERKKLFSTHPPKTVYVSSSRLKCAKDGKFDDMGSSTTCYCWFVWEKGYTGETKLKWFN